MIQKDGNPAFFPSAANNILFPWFELRSAADRFVQLPCRHSKFVESSLHSSPPFPLSLLTDKSKMTLMIWAMAEGHCGPQHLATASPFPTEFRIRHAAFIFRPVKFIPGWILYFEGIGQSLERLMGFLAIFGGSMYLYFRGAKLAMYFSQNPHMWLCLLTSKLVHVLRISSLS